MSVSSGTGCGTGPPRSLLQRGTVLHSWLSYLRGRAYIRRVCAQERGEGQKEDSRFPIRPHNWARTTGKGQINYCPWWRVRRRISSRYNCVHLLLQISREQQNRVLEFIQSGISEGAKLECGGKARGLKGFYIEPTVFSNVRDDMRIAREEVKGVDWCPSRDRDRRC